MKALLFIILLVGCGANAQKVDSLLRDYMRRSDSSFQAWVKKDGRFRFEGGNLVQFYSPDGTQNMEIDSALNIQLNGIDSITAIKSLMWIIITVNERNKGLLDGIREGQRSVERARKRKTSINGGQ